MINKVDFVRCLLPIWIELSSRIGLRDAYIFKKNKSRLRKEKKLRTPAEKLLGIYHRSQTNAPYHIMKYSIIRICNFALILGLLVCYILPHEGVLSDISWCLTGIQALFLLLPLFLDTLLLTKWGSADKRLDFSRSRKP